MTEIQRGFRGKIDDYLNSSNDMEITIAIAGKGEYDSCCFGVDANEKLSDDSYMIFYNQTASPKQEVIMTGSGSHTAYRVNLAKLPDHIRKLVFTVSIDGNGVMSDVQGFSVVISQNGKSLSLNMIGAVFHSEKAVIAIEIYKKDVWRIAAVASGFNGGLSALLKHFGGEEASGKTPPQTIPEPQGFPVQEAPVQEAPVPPAHRNPFSFSQKTPDQEVPAFQGTPAPNNTGAPLNLTKVELRKGQKVNLEKGASSGEIVINLNWTRKMFRSIDLDLACMVECMSGEKYLIQALGNGFGASDREPYVTLDGDDRTGSATGGENLRVNGKMIDRIKRILVFTFIYEGAANWQQADGVVTIKYPGGGDIIVRLDEYGSRQKMCAIAEFVNVQGTLQVEKLVRFFNGHEALDRAYNWGFRWKAGSK